MRYRHTAGLWDAQITAALQFGATIPRHSRRACLQIDDDFFLAPCQKLTTKMQNKSQVCVRASNESLKLAPFSFGLVLLLLASGRCWPPPSAARELGRARA